MKILLDFFPIILFFIFYKTLGLYPAIYAMIAATALQMGVSRFKTGKFENTNVIAFGLLIVFGGITLAVRDPAFLMWKVSVLYVVFALALIFSIFIGKKTLLQRMLGKELDLPAKTWEVLTWFWGLGFVLIAIVNGYYVKIALSSREIFFSSDGLDDKLELATFDCASIVAQQACLIAKENEEAWVNFKLFGTMGMTFVLIIITVVFMSKYIKNKQ